MFTHIKKILVVDDETELAHAIELHLSRSGFFVTSVGTFSEAQEMIGRAYVEKNLLDLVIADISLPGNSGIELLQWIQNCHPQISIILICGFGADDLIAGNIRPVMDDFCKKPFSPKTLLDKIRTIEQRRKKQHKSCEMV